MHVTREGDYAVRVVVALAAAPPGRIVRTEDLTHATGVPRAYLKKIVQALCRAHLVETRSGQGGGVRLHKDAATITLRDMVEAVEGPIYLNRCLVRPGVCPRDGFCSVHPVWARIQRILVRELDAVTARELAGAPCTPPDGGAAAGDAHDGTDGRASVTPAPPRVAAGYAVIDGAGTSREEHA